MEMINKPEVIATIGYSVNNVEKYLEGIWELGVHYFRFNFAKCYNDLKSFENKSLELKELCDKYGNDIKVMIDLPYPGIKPRILIENEKIEIRKSEKLVITTHRNLINEDYKILCVENHGARIDLKEGEKIFYADGECCFQVLKIMDRNTILVESDKEVEIYNHKSLSFGKVEKMESMDRKHIELINMINAKSIALSFVTSAEEVEKYQELFSQKEIVSKIESREGIIQIDQISKKSNIMLGRGDLCLNANYYNLYEYQQRVAHFCKANGSSLYIATGILNSLNKYSIPSQSDIIDVSNIILLKPSYLILNYPLVDNNCKYAIKTINQIYNCMIEEGYNSDESGCQLNKKCFDTK